MAADGTGAGLRSTARRRGPVPDLTGSPTDWKHPPAEARHNIGEAVCTFVTDLLFTELRTRRNTDAVASTVARPIWNGSLAGHKPYPHPLADISHMTFARIHGQGTWTLL